MRSFGIDEKEKENENENENENVKEKEKEKEKKKEKEKEKEKPFEIQPYREATRVGPSNFGLWWQGLDCCYLRDSTDSLMDRRYPSHGDWTKACCCFDGVGGRDPLLWSVVGVEVVGVQPVF